MMYEVIFETTSPYLLILCVFSNNDYVEGNLKCSKSRKHIAAGTESAFTCDSFPLSPQFPLEYGANKNVLCTTEKTPIAAYWQL